MAFYRRDDWVNNALGQAVPNTAVSYYTQSTMTPATVYTDPAGTVGTNPQYTDGFGRAVAYLVPDRYTITYSGPQIVTLTLPDQIIADFSASAGAMNVEVPTGTPNGSLRTFGISGAPVIPTSSQLYQNGSLVYYGVAYTISGSTITWIAALAPQEGDSLVLYWV